MFSEICSNSKPKTKQRWLNLPVLLPSRLFSKSFLFAVSLFILSATACHQDVVDKPKKLISRDKMIKILVDIHLAESVYQIRKFDIAELKNCSESDFYYSVLRLHHVADSTFENSLIYYSGKPKEFEKIYTRVLNRLNEMEQEIIKKKQMPVNTENPVIP